LSKKIDGKKIINLYYLSRMALQFNSISGLTGQTPEEIIAALLSRNSSIRQLLDAVFACLSQKPVQELLALVESSALFSRLKTINDLIKSRVIDELIQEMILEQILREMFSNLSNSREGIENLIAVIALLVLVRIPTNDVSIADDERIEDLKLLFRSTLFHNDIVTIFLLFEEEQHLRRNQCPCRRNQRPCVNCNARFILSIGWYVAAQEAHNRNAFVKNSNFLVVSAPLAHNIKAFVANSKLMV
jgi:hypothetical protein